MCSHMGDATQGTLEIVDYVRIPEDLAPGNYVLGWYARSYYRTHAARKSPSDRCADLTVYLVLHRLAILVQHVGGQMPRPIEYQAMGL